jgi:excinuclease ABC subunit C
MKINYFKKTRLPNKPGVYFFYNKKQLLYIGKATSLRDRVKSYFGKDLIVTRGPLLLDMVTQADSIKWQETDSVLEALILEANLIKKYQPKYNTKEKDNKSFNYVCITKDELPKVLVLRGRGLNKELYNKIYGPFPNGMQLKDAMKIIRRIFPYIDEQSSKKNNKEFYKQLGLIPDINASKQDNYFSQVLGSPAQHFGRGRAQPDHSKNNYLASQQEYKKNIKNLKLFFEGKKKSIIINLKKEMFSLAKKKEFEKAGEIKKRLFALMHINDVALIKEDTSYESSFHQVLGSPAQHFEKGRAQPDHSEKNFRIPLYRIEAYDIAHLSGSNMVGVMTVIENGQLVKHEYKKFIIRTQASSNDTGALEEVLSRRFRHVEWGLPSLIVMDGSTAQINVAKSVLNRYQYKIPVVAVVKDDKHKAKAIIGNEEIIKKYKKDILLINSESHRFAITFHKKRRNKNFLI